MEASPNTGMFAPYAKYVELLQEGSLFRCIVYWLRHRRVGARAGRVVVRAVLSERKGIDVLSVCK